MKKLLSVLMALAVLLSCTVVSFAEESDVATIGVVEDTFVRKGKDVQNSGLLVVNNGWSSYLKFDISALRTAMDNKDARYILQFTSRFDTKAGDVYAYGISGENRTGWSDSSLTYILSVNNGMESDVSDYLGKATVTTKDETVTVDVTDYIQSVPEDGIATIKLQNNTLAANVVLCDSTSDTPPLLTATRTYREGSEEVFEGIEIPGMVDGDITLPENGNIYGSKIVWSSSNPDVISAEGVVSKGDKPVKVTLTATYEGYSDVQKTFDVIVLENGAVSSATMVVTEDLLARAGGSASNSYGSADQYWVTNADLSCLKFNVNELRNAIGNKDAKYTLTVTSRGDAAAGAVNVYGITGANRIAWDESFSYNNLNELGINTDLSNLIGTINVTAANTKYSIDVTDYIQSVPEDGIASLKLQNTTLEDGVKVTFYAKHQNVNADNYTTLTAERSGREGSEEVFEGIEIPEIIEGDITLPTTGIIYGSKIVWSSSNPDVISAEGVVTRATKPVKVTLTATYEGYSDVQKTFDVIVLESGAVFSGAINVSEDALVRAGKGENNFGGSTVKEMWASESDSSYIKFNVNDLKTIMRGKDAEYILSLTSKNSTAYGEVNVYGINGENRTAWTETELTYNMTVGNGMDSDVSNLLGTINVTAPSTVYTLNVTDYIKTIPEDGIVTFKLQNKSLSTSEVRFWTKEYSDGVSTLSAKRTFAEFDADIFDGIEIPSVVRENLKLPVLSITDEELSWESSVPEVIAADGTVTRQNYEALVTLSVSGDGRTKSFDVIVPALDETETFTQIVSEDIYTRGGSVYAENYYPGTVLQVVDDSRSTYLKFDLANLRAAMNGKDAEYILNISTTADSVNAAEGYVNVYALSCNDWSELDLTHNKAAEKGMYDDISNKIGELTVIGRNTTFQVDITDYINSVSEDINIITLKLDSAVSNLTGTTVFESKETNPNAAPSITAVRTYKDDYSNGINPVIYVNGKTCEALSAGVATARVAFMNNAVTAEPEGSLIIALYNDTALINVKSVSMDFTTGAVNDMSVSIDVPAGDNYSVKAFLVRGIDTLAPLTQSVELK